jgi:hypothetical protein
MTDEAANEAAAETIRGIAAARAASPALGRAMANAPLRSVYSICVRSDMDPADQERLEDAALVLHRARDKALGHGGALGHVLEEW